MSNHTTPQLYTEINPSHWVYQEPIDGRNGRGKSIYVNSSETNRSNPCFQLPKCRVPFGVREGMEQKADATRLNMEISVEDPRLESLLKQIDATNLNILEQKSTQCFSRQLSKDTLIALYRSVLQYGKGDYAPLCRTKVCVSRAVEGEDSNGQRRKSRQTNVIVVQKESESGQILEYAPGTLSDIHPHSIVLPVIEVGGMWIVNGKCGISFVVTDIMVWPQKVKNDFPFLVGDGTSGRPKKVSRVEEAEPGVRENDFDPIDMETTVVNLPMMEED